MINSSTHSVAIFALSAGSPSALSLAPKATVYNILSGHGILPLPYCSHIFVMSTPLSQLDPDVFGILNKEHQRQKNSIELTASANYVSRAVLEATGSILTNKVAAMLSRSSLL